MATATSRASIGPDPASVVTKAVMRAARRLGLTNRALADIIGISEASASRMGNGAFALQPGQKPFELALLLVRLYRSLDAIAGGDDDVARTWLRSGNAALAGSPLDLIRTVPGLVNVIAYLDARRAVV